MMVVVKDVSDNMTVDGVPENLFNLTLKDENTCY